MSQIHEQEIQSDPEPPEPEFVEVDEGGLSNAQIWVVTILFLLFLILMVGILALCVLA